MLRMNMMRMKWRKWGGGGGGGGYQGHLLSFMSFLAHMHHPTAGNCTECLFVVDLPSIKMNGRCCSAHCLQISVPCEGM